MSASVPVAQQTTTDPVSTTIVTAIADTTGKRIEELPPLYSVVDPDALDSLYECGRSTVSGVRVRFSFAGCHVEVDDGEVTVTEDVTADDHVPASLAADR